MHTMGLRQVRGQYVSRQNRFLHSDKTAMKTQTNMTISHTSYSSHYRCENHSIVVPMLYPTKAKSPYMLYIQAFDNFLGDSERT